MASAAHRIEQLAVDTIRTLSMDAVEAARSGHPEHAHTGSVETTTGPLGQGLGNSARALEEDPKLADEIERAIREKAGLTPAKTPIEEAANAA